MKCPKCSKEFKEPKVVKFGFKPYKDLKTCPHCGSGEVHIKN